MVQFGEAIVEFERDHGSWVEWLGFPDGQLWSQMTTSIMAGTTIDLYMMSNSWHAELGGLLALVLQRFIISGLTQGGVKG